MSKRITPEEIAHSLCEQWRKKCGEPPADAEQLITNLLKRAHIDGLREGIRLYAWWQDGVQMVGTCGKTLEQALADVNKRAQDYYESEQDEPGIESVDEDTRYHCCPYCDGEVSFDCPECGGDGWI